MPSPSQWSDPEWKALAALYNATDGPNWRRSTNWLSNRHIREWHGITTNAKGQVIVLNLSAWNRLKGEIPAELGNLSDLTEMRLRNNRFTGCMPESLRSVPVNDFDELGLPFC